MNRRELLKQAPAVGVLALAAAPLARARNTPSLSVKTATASHTVSSAEVSAGFAKITANWSTAFPDTNYVPVGDFSYLGTNDGPNNSCVNGGITGLTTTSISIIVEFNGAGCDSGDTINVYFIGVEGA
jgi:hypothetical protein